MSGDRHAGAVPVLTDPDEAASRLAAGGVVAIPTETVYGLAASLDRPDAIARVFAIKGRPTDHPLIVHLDDAARLAEYVAAVPDAAATLAATCWPGPLTMLLAKSERVPAAVTGGCSTVGVRVPAHPSTQQVLRTLGTAVAAPSANRFGAVSPTTAEHVLADLGEYLDPRRDAILDGGASSIGVESTIVDCTVEPPQVLRPGAIAAADVERLLGVAPTPATGPARAAGMLAAHYAPRSRVVLGAPGDVTAIADELRRSGERVVVVDRTADLVDYARFLYADLRAADDAGATVVVAALPTASGLGVAIEDRLRKAAAAHE